MNYAAGSLLVLMAFVLVRHPVYAAEKLWAVQSVDTMKYSRDRSRDPKVVTKIPVLTKSVASLGASHIALGTPYDEEFYPLLKTWVREARKNNINVWFRGNFSGWEDWFDYGRTVTPADHIRLTAEFIEDHPDLFEPGDIFTPAPEPENGAIGDPRRSTDNGTSFNQFLIDSYNVCISAFASINKKVTCGYFSTNGDVAKEKLTRETVSQIGGVVVIDHYIKDPTKMTADILFLAEKLNAKIVVGEFGGPILDLNGPMTETQQAAFNRILLDSIYKAGPQVIGVNYWTVADGSTALLNPNFSIRETTFTLFDYYKPSEIEGQVLSSDNIPIYDALVFIGSRQTKTDRQGNYRIAVPSGEYTMGASADSHKPYSKILTMGKHEKRTLKITLDTDSPSWWGRLNNFILKLFPLGR